MTLFTFLNKIYLSVIRRTNSLKYARIVGVKFGKGCKFINPHFGTEPYLIRMGDHVEVTNNVRFITHDGGVWVFRDQYPDIEKFAPITIGSNVFIGTGAILLPGVTIGDNCVIGAGAVVSRNIPSDSVAAGVPAKVLKTTDGYYDSVRDVSTHIRNCSLKEKKNILQKKFGL